ncbi:MAG: phosphoribosylamine--glycine ligase [Saprospiraceae bacterium]
MNILILGGGGREHALAWKIKQSPLCDQLFIAPGNPGTAGLGTNIHLSLKDFDKIRETIEANHIELVLIGPEEPLVLGLTDYLESHFDPAKVHIIGPTKIAAQLEGSKAFAKEFMEEFNIPTARYHSFIPSQIDDAIDYIQGMNTPIVVKADGLAAGKGVTICQSHHEAINEVKDMFDGKFGAASSVVVLEEFLSGKEFSVFVLTDGHDYKILPVAKDYKKIGERDAGPNTGGMGAVSPVSFVTASMMKEVEDKIIIPTIEGLNQKNYRYHGFVFIGLIEVGSIPYVIEYNCRMGDPETEVVMPRLKTDLVPLLLSLNQGTLASQNVEQINEAACTVVMVSGGYPGDYEKNKLISIPIVVPTSSIIFHSGTKMEDGHLLTNGGRVLAITSTGDHLSDALRSSYELIKQIDYEGQYFRKDIGFDV